MLFIISLKHLDVDTLCKLVKTALLFIEIIHKLLEYERHLFLLGHYIKTEPSIDINACAVLQIYKMFIVVKIVALFVVSKVVIYNVVCLQDWEG